MSLTFNQLLILTAPSSIARFESEKGLSLHFSCLLKWRFHLKKPPNPESHEALLTREVRRVERISECTILEERPMKAQCVVRLFTIEALTNDWTK